MNKSILILIAFLGSVKLTQAAVLISQSETAPVDNIIREAADFSNGNLNWNGYGTTASSWRDAGQSFLAPGDFSLEAFTFRLASFGAQAQGADITVSIFETNTAGEAMQNGTLLSTQQGALPETLISGQYVTFALDDAVVLSQGKYYTVMLHFDERGGDSTAANRRQIMFSIGSFTDDPLGAGASYWLASDPFTSYSKGNTIMTSYFQGSVIPEPSTMGLLIGAGLLLFRLGRIHSKRMAKQS